MTQSEFAVKYDVPLTFISALISETRTQPDRRVKGKTRMVKDFDERTMVEIVLKEYQKRYDENASRAKEWREKATQIKSIYKNGREKHGNAEVPETDC